MPQKSKVNQTCWPQVILLFIDCLLLLSSGNCQSVCVCVWGGGGCFVVWFLVCFLIQQSSCGEKELVALLKCVVSACVLCLSQCAVGLSVFSDCGIYTRKTHHSNVVSIE